MPYDNQIDLGNPFGLPEFDDEQDDMMSSALARVMKTPEGRSVIYMILEETGLYNATFAGNSMDIYMNGKRGVGLWLLAAMDDIDPTCYPRMLLDVTKRGLEQRNSHKGTK